MKSAFSGSSRGLGERVVSFSRCLSRAVASSADKFFFLARCVPVVAPANDVLAARGELLVAGCRGIRLFRDFLRGCIEMSLVPCTAAAAASGICCNILEMCDIFASIPRWEPVIRRRRFKVCGVLGSQRQQ